MHCCIRRVTTVSLFLIGTFFPSGIGLTSAQSSYPPTLLVPVTFYDFHSDSSCPEFEITPPGDDVHVGMVARALDSDKKPTLGATPFYNRKIARWFRPWVAGDFQIYNYYGEYDTKRFDRYQSLPTGLTNVATDTSFKNVVIRDTVEFRYIPGSSGMYEFVNDNFFPLDNRGFGAEGRSHNYSFSMELHWTFTMVPGLTFNFSGDDDVWAFVNNQLAMDIGGIHGPKEGAFRVDDIAGLTPNKQFSFDLFYAERHVTGSNIRITTNIIAPPSNLQVFSSPNPPGGGNPPVSLLDNVKAGDPVTLYGHVFDTSGAWLREFDSLVTWRLQSQGSAKLSQEKGAATTVSSDASLAGLEITLIATFVNPNDNSQPPSQVVVRIRFATKSGNPGNPENPGNPGDPGNPGEPAVPVEDHLDIVVDSLAARNKEAKESALVFAAEVMQREVSAVVRDADGNFIRFADEAQWRSVDIQIVDISPRQGNKTVVNKVENATGDRTLIIVSATGLTPDTVEVLLRAQERRAVVPNPFRPGQVDIATILPPKALANYANVIESAPTRYVTLVAIEAPMPLKPTGVVVSVDGKPLNSYAEVVVYDAAGNKIRDDLPLIAGANRLAYGVAWDGTNHSRRIVGTGAYLMIIKAHLESGSGYVLQQKIGIIAKP